MTVSEAIAALSLEQYAGITPETGARELTGGYAGDLLSCAMAGARYGQAWVTVQAHKNVVAIASLTEVSCVILSEGSVPDDEVRATAEREGIPLLGSPLGTYSIVAQLTRLGVPG